jgi:hypothetical protein
MADRFGRRYDRNLDGRPDLPNSFTYVNPGRYEVRLAAYVNLIGVTPADMAYTWTIVGPDTVIQLPTTGQWPSVWLREGNYSAAVTVQLSDGRTGSARETIRVHDILIVAMGDSLATGEGNPEKPAIWEGISAPGGGLGLRGRRDPSTPADWANGGPDGDRPRLTAAGSLPPANELHSRAHRSTHSGAAQFAMRLEAADPHSSVTFVCLAATGARTDDLFTVDRSGQNKALGPGPPLPAQLDELHAIAGSRPVDILILAIGFNDARGIDLVGELLKSEIRCIDPLRLLAAYPTRRAWSAATVRDLDALVDAREVHWYKGKEPGDRRKIIDQDVSVIYKVAEAAEAGLASARGEIERVGQAVAKDPILARADVFLLEYPDLTRDANGATAPAILDDLVPMLRVNRRELDLAREQLVRPLNDALRQAADHRGWTYADGIFDSFGSHGYAAEDTWFVRAKESEQVQGPILSPMGYLRGEIAPGMLHPNKRGHQAIAEELLRTCGPRMTRPYREGGLASTRERQPAPRPLAAKGAMRQRTPVNQRQDSR